MLKTTNVFETNGYDFDELETICRKKENNIIQRECVKTLINAYDALKVNKIIESGKPYVPHTVASETLKMYRQVGSHGFNANPEMIPAGKTAASVAG